MNYEKRISVDSEDVLAFPDDLGGHLFFSSLSLPRGVPLLGAAGQSPRRYRCAHVHIYIYIHIQFSSVVVLRFKVRPFSVISVCVPWDPEREKWPLTMVVRGNKQGEAAIDSNQLMCTREKSKIRIFNFISSSFLIITLELMSRLY